MTTINLTTITQTVLNQDVLSIIDGYKTSAEHFELHQKTTEKMRYQFAFIEKVILDTEETRYQYQDKTIVNCGYGDYILDWIKDEKRAEQEAEFFEHFEIDYGLTDCDGHYNEVSGECYCSHCN